MKRVVSIGGIVLDNHLFIDDFNSDIFIGVEKLSTTNDYNVFTMNKSTHAIEVQLSSKDNGWLKEDTIKSILSLNPEVSHTLEILNDDNISCSMDFSSNFLIKTPIHLASNWYLVKINFLKD